MQLATQIQERKKLQKRMSCPFNQGERRKFCGDADIVPNDEEIGELDPSEFEMNGDNFILPVFFRT